VASSPLNLGGLMQEPEFIGIQIRFDTLVILVAWTLWKQRSAIVFGNVKSQLNTIQIVEKIKEEFSLWELGIIGGKTHMTRV
jgi:hypothetical protein